MRCLLPVVAAVLAFGVPARAEAQVCHGRLPLGSDRHMNVAVGLATLEGATLASGHVTSVNFDFGVGEYYGRTSVAQNVYSAYGYSSNEVDLAAGQAVDVWPQSKLVLCPEFELWLEHASNLGPAVSLSSTAETAVASLRAGSLHAVGRVPVLGFVGGGFYHSTEKVVAPVPGFGSDTQASSSFGGFAEAGVGIHAFRLVDLVISYRVPVGVKLGLRSTAVLVGMSF